MKRVTAALLVALALSLSTAADTRENPRSPGLFQRIVRAISHLLVPMDGPMPPHP